MGKKIVAEDQVNASIRNEELIREVLDQACDHSEIAILATPYMRFESCFLRLEEGMVHCHASMDLEDAKFGLRSPDLKIRFPHGQHFYEGATRLMGLGRAKGRPSLQLAIPVVLENGDYRRSYRVERVGRVPITFSTRRYDLLTGTLVNISTTGIRLYLNRDYEDGEMLVDDLVHVAFTLADDIRINAKVKVRHLRERTFGAEFRPPLEGDLLERLSRWAFQKREEDILALGRAAARTPGEPAQESAAELILLSPSAELGERLAPLLAGVLPPLRRAAPTIQSVRDLGPVRKALVLLHVDSASWEARKRVRTLAEALPATLPKVLIGTGVDTAALFELGNELKAAWTYPLQPTPGSIFPRLLQGIYRKHFPENQD
ncbi:MAG: PilZ domain-containing protein [Holophaga sp.]|jgi:hypothetical protein